MKKILINLILFQLGWFFCVLGGDLYALVYLPIALLLHQCLVLTDRGEWWLILAVAIVGSCWDVLMVQVGVMHYGSDLLFGIPLWLLCLWLLFATTFRYSLFWLRQNLWLTALLAALVGPANYWLGTKITEASIASPVLLSLGIMAIGWALLFPCCLYYAGKSKD
jgi:hypothetical protein